MNNIDLNMYIQNTITIVLAVAGLITAIGGAFTFIKKWASETKASKCQQTLDDHEKRIISNKAKIELLEKKSNKQDKFTEVICNSLLALLDHSINGDSKEQLKSAKDELENFLIRK